jgi:hypothetical protein
MTKVIHLPSPRAGTRVHASAHTTSPTTTPTVAQQAAIENALTMALYFMRQSGDSAANLWAATARANRALTLLKHVGGGTAQGSAANVLGRA